MKSLEGKDGILSVSLSHGFSFADVEDVGTRTLVVADRDKSKAEALAKKLGEELWANRERYATKYLSIPEAMERAASHNQGPWCWPIAPTIQARAHRAIRPSCCRHLSTNRSARHCSA